MVAQDPGASFRLLHPSGSADSAPPVLPILTAALRAHVDAGSEPSSRPASPPGVRPTSFHALSSPSIQVEAYVDRLYRYTKCSPVCLVMAFAYIQRLAAADPLLQPSPRNVHRMLIAGTMLAAKFTDDRYYTNRYYAQVGGVTLAELNRLELELLDRLGYRAHVDVPELCACLKHIQSAADGGAAWAAQHPHCSEALAAAAAPSAAKDLGTPFAPGCMDPAQPFPLPAAAQASPSPTSSLPAAPPVTLPASGPQRQPQSNGVLGSRQRESSGRQERLCVGSGGSSPSCIMPPDWPSSQLRVQTPGLTMQGGAEGAGSGGGSPRTPCACQQGMLAPLCEALVGPACGCSSCTAAMMMAREGGRAPSGGPAAQAGGQASQLTLALAMMGCKQEHAEAAPGEGVTVQAA